MSKTKNKKVGPTIDDSVEQFIAWKKKLKNKSDPVLRSRLLGVPVNSDKKTSYEDGGSIYYMQKILKVTHANQINFTVLSTYNQFIWYESKAPVTTKSNKISSLKAYLKWAIDHKHVEICYDDLKLIKQKMAKKSKIVLPPQKLLSQFKTGPDNLAFGNSRFDRLRNYLFFTIVALVNGARPFKEILTLREDTFDELTLEMKLIRKGSDSAFVNSQTISFRRDHAELVKNYKDLRATQLSNFPKVKDGRDAFFINDKPENDGGKLTWKLTEEAFGRIFDTIVSKIGYLKVSAYGLRRASITNQIENGRFINIDLSEIAHRNGNTAQVTLNHYKDYLGWGVEVITRDPIELREFLERMCGYHITQFLKNPNEFRFLAGFIKSFTHLGEAQFRDAITEYRENLSTDIFNESNFNSFAELISKLKVSPQNSDWKTALGCLILNIFAPVFKSQSKSK